MQCFNSLVVIELAPVIGGCSGGVLCCSHLLVLWILSMRKYAGYEASAHTLAPAAVVVDESVERPVVCTEPDVSGKGFLTPHAGFYSPETPHLNRTSCSEMPPRERGEKTS